MRIATINISGNVGKTTVAKNLLYPRLPGAQIFEIESVNTGIQLKSAVIKTMRASSYGGLIDSLSLLESAIIDVGASNVEGFLTEMHELDGSYDDIDCFLIPVIKDDKVMKESVKTAMLLSGLGAPADKIKFVFNRFPRDLDVREVFAPVFKIAADDGSYCVDKSAVIYENPVYAALNKAQISLLELNNDTTDYREALRQAKDEKEQQAALAMIANKRRASSATKNLDDVFAALFGKK